MSSPPKNNRKVMIVSFHDKKSFNQPLGNAISEKNIIVVVSIGVTAFAAFRSGPLQRIFI